MHSPGRQEAVLQGPRGTGCAAGEAPPGAGWGALCLRKVKKSKVPTTNTKPPQPLWGWECSAHCHSPALTAGK